MDIKEYTIEVEHNKQNHPWEYARFEVIVDLISPLLKNKKSLNILDIGCGDTFFLHQLSNRFEDCNFFAVDTAFTPDILTSFQEKYKDTNIKLYQNLSDFSADCDKIDLVLLLDVIEHVEDDVDLLSSLHTLQGFHSETLVVVTAPAYQALFCSHDEWLRHHRRYSNKLLQQRLREAYFYPMQSGYFFFTLLLPRVIQRTKERFIKPDLSLMSGIGSWNGGKFLTKIIKSVLIMDYKFSKLLRHLGIKLPGLSCYCIATQKTFVDKNVVD